MAPFVVVHVSPEVRRRQGADLDPRDGQPREGATGERRVEAERRDGERGQDEQRREQVPPAESGAPVGIRALR